MVNSRTPNSVDISGAHSFPQKILPNSAAYLGKIVQIT